MKLRNHECMNRVGIIVRKKASEPTCQNCMEVVKLFFQKPNVNFKKTGVWYVRCPVGKNSIANFMKVISEKAGLSRKNTNHCLRVTAISVLRWNGIDDGDIRSVSRHKTTDCTRPYCTGPPDKQRYRISSMLHDHGHSGDSDRTVAIPERRPQPDSPVPSTSELHLPRPARTSQANVTSSPMASTSDRQFGHETVSPADDDSEILAVSSSSSGGGRPGNKTMVVSSQSEQKLLKSIFAGAVAPPCLTSMEILIFFEWTFCVMCQCIF